MINNQVKVWIDQKILEVQEKKDLSLDLYTIYSSDGMLKLLHEFKEDFNLDDIKIENYG
jgi:patatin-like phospholipase/acyl hydrolase